MELILKPNGYTIEKAINKDSFERAIRTSLPDLIIMDVTLPDTSGIDLTRSLKANPKTKMIPVVLSTAMTNPQEKADQAGADAFIAKPFDIEAFDQIIRDFL